MRICAVTMVYRDYWALSQWFAHFATALGAENLFIVSHGPDPHIHALCPGASVITIPRDDLTQFDKLRNRFLNQLQNGLSHCYDWVIRTDADELVILDPRKFSSFADFFAKQDGGAVFGLGMEVVEMRGDAKIRDHEPALAQRRNVVFTGHYSKAWAVRHKIGMDRHGIELRPRQLRRFSFVMPRGVYIAHLKFANKVALGLADDIRTAVAHSPGKGLPGTAWSDAQRQSRRQFNRFSKLPLQPWDTAEDEAWTALQTPIRDESSGIMRAKSLRFDFRSELPEWFATNGFSPVAPDHKEATGQR